MKMMVDATAGAWLSNAELDPTFLRRTDSLQTRSTSSSGIRILEFCLFLTGSINLLVPYWNGTYDAFF
jgi:hypothetical protein